MFIPDELKTSIAGLHEELEHRPQRYDPLLSILRTVLSMPLPVATETDRDGEAQGHWRTAPTTSKRGPFTSLGSSTKRSATANPIGWRPRVCGREGHAPRGDAFALRSPMRRHVLPVTGSLPNAYGRRWEEVSKRVVPVDAFVSTRTL